MMIEDAPVFVAVPVAITGGFFKRKNIRGSRPSLHEDAASMPFSERMALAGKYHQTIRMG